MILNDYVFNAVRDHTQEDPEILALDGNRYVVVWTDFELDSEFTIEGHSGVRLSLFSTDALRWITDYQVHNETKDEQAVGGITAIEDGFVVAFFGAGPDKFGVDDGYFDGYFQLFDENAVPQGQNIQFTLPISEDYRVQDIATLADGSFVIITARGDRAAHDLEAHRFAADGTRIGTTALLQDFADLGIAIPGTNKTPGANVIPQADGGYLLVWWQDIDDVDGHTWSILARGFTAEGAPTGDLQIVSPAVVSDRFVLDRHTYPQTNYLGDGRTLIAWDVDPDDDGPTESATLIRIVDRNGVPVSPVIKAADDDVFHPMSILGLPGGLSLIAYEVTMDYFGGDDDEMGVALRLYDDLGVQIGDPLLISEFTKDDIDAIQMTVTETGEFVITWDGGSITSKDILGGFYDLAEVLGRIVGVPLVLLGGKQDDVVEGGDQTEFIRTHDGDDEVRAGKGDDQVEGGAGADEVWGNGGNDEIDGGPGDDVLRGSKGQDRVWGQNGHDTIRGQSDDDSLYGGAGDDNIKGGGGADYIAGDAGHDFLKGGTSSDTVIGGDGHDRMAGNKASDVLVGGGGSDNLKGGGGDDRLDGGAGDDRLKGGNGADVFVFDDGMGRDVVVDFEIGVDRLELTGALVGFVGTDGAAIVQRFDAEVGGRAALDFGDGDVIVFDGLTSLDGVAAGILVV